jgi:hypothetical protein
MTRAALFVLLVSAVAHAAPVPKETEAEKLKRLYGAPVSADPKCKFSLDGDKLCVRVPPGGHAWPEAVTVPRTSRKVTGDFTLEVGVRIKVPEGANATQSKAESVLSAGLVVWADGKNAALHTFEIRPDRRKPLPVTTTHLRYEGSNQGGQKLLDDSVNPRLVHLRLVREGNVIRTLGKGAGGRSDLWWAFPDFEWPKAPQAVEVGVVVEHNLDKPIEVVFEDFKFTPPSTTTPMVK